MNQSRKTTRQFMIKVVMVSSVLLKYCFLLKTFV
jgi:hypothetical protein